MNQPLSSFLARQGDSSEILLPRIINQEDDRLFMVLSQGGNLQIEPVNDPGLKMENLSFGRRMSLNGKQEVFSIGGVPTSLDWLYVIETPASQVESAINSRKLQIYGIGALASLGIALFCAWLWSGYRSRYYQTEAIKFQKLYTTINDQKMVLDSINSSFQAGLALVDAWGRVQMANPAFCEICGIKGEIEKGTPLVKTMPDKVAVHLLEDITNVREASHTASDEITVPMNMPDGQKEDRLFRVSLYPYAEKGEADTRISGCVLIFKDITDFRRKAIEEKEKVAREQARQKALIRAFQRAIESVDPHLLGQSDKMAAIAELLSNELQFDKTQRETLDLSARLSQVGKIYVPHHLLTRKGQLTPEEKAELHKAPEHAQRILRELDFDLPIRETVGEIYERMDGSGKPNGLPAEKISACGRALGIINAFIAMTSPRAWRNAEAMSVSEALQEMRANRGFDQNIVDALAQIPVEKLASIVNSGPENASESGEDKTGTA